jgi:enediyne biosynthesis protein E5
MTAAIKSHSGKLASVPPPPVEFKRDPRYLALRNFAISISIFTILGYTVLGFEQPWLWPVFAVLTGYATEVVMELVQAWFERRKPRFMGVSPRETMAFFLPAHITSLAVNMLLYANESFWPVMFGVIVGVSAKAVLQAPINGRMRHFMNPSNFGIITTLVFFSWVNLGPPYMFTEHVSDIFKIGIPIVIITAGTVINATLTKRVPLIVGFLGGFVIQALVRWWWFDVAISSAFAVMTGVAFVLFTNYMITDPGTTPSKGMNQFMFGGTVAATYGVLMAFNVVYTLFFATAITCGLRGAYWWVNHLQKKRAEKTAIATTPPVTTGTEAVAA